MIRPFAAAALLAASSLAYAQAPLDFNSITLQYLQSDADNGDGDGFGLRAELGVFEHYFVQAEYSARAIELDFAGNPEIDLNFGRIGAGGFYPLDEAGRVAVFGGLSFEYVDVSGSGGGTVTPDPDTGGEGGGGGPTGTDLDLLLCFILTCEEGSAFGTKALSAAGDDDSTGYGAQLGIRAEVMPNLEAGLSYQFRSYEDYTRDDDDEQVIGVHVAYRFGQWAAVLTYDNYDTLELDEYLLGVRYDFARE